MTTASQLEYRPLPDWEQLPEGIQHRDVSDVAVDARDRVYLVTRFDPQVVVYEQDGTFVTAWGKDVLSKQPHGITTGPDGSIWIADQGDQTVRKFTADGEQLLVLGTSGQPSDTGYDTSIADFTERTKTIQRSAGPFNQPTNVEVAANGDVYVSDGYGNARIHKFSADGELLASWGEPGIGEGQFTVPHDLCIDDQGRMLVCDRDNDRVQLFTLDGEHLDTWQSQRPCAIHVHDGLVHVAETRWSVGTYSFTRGEITEVEWARVSVYDHDGRLLERFGKAGVWPDDAVKPGYFTSAHGLAVDSRGDVYVAETTWTSCAGKGIVPEDCHTFQKFERS